MTTDTKGTVSDKAAETVDEQEFINCPLCCDLGGIKRWEMDQYRSQQAEIARLRLLYSSLERANVQYQDQVTALEKERDELKAEVERLENLAKFKDARIERDKARVQECRALRAKVERYEECLKFYARIPGMCGPAEKALEG